MAASHNSCHFQLSDAGGWPKSRRGQNRDVRFRFDSQKNRFFGRTISIFESIICCSLSSFWILSAVTTLLIEEESIISWVVWYFPSAYKDDIKAPKAAIFIDLIKPRVEVSFHVSVKCKAVNELPITEKLKISFFLKVLCNWLFVFCFALCAHIEQNLNIDSHWLGYRYRNESE